MALNPCIWVFIKYGAGALEFQARLNQALEIHPAIPRLGTADGSKLRLSKGFMQERNRSCRIYWFGLRTNIAATGFFGLWAVCSGCLAGMGSLLGS
jgi:hypothetical protein